MSHLSGQQLIEHQAQELAKKLPALDLRTGSEPGDCSHELVRDPVNVGGFAEWCPGCGALRVLIDGKSEWHLPENAP